MAVLNQVLLRVTFALLLATSIHAHGQERICPDGKRSYFGVCPDDGNNSRPIPAPTPAPVVAPAPQPATPSTGNTSNTASFTVPFAPGGPTDVFVRSLAQNLGPQAVVENKPGNFGITSLQLFVQSPRDGVAYYVLTAGTLHNLKRSNQSALIQQVEPVALIGIQGFAVLAPASRSIKSLQGLVASSKGRRLTGGTSGEGSLPELCLKQLSQALGLSINLIPYKGVAPVLIDLSEGNIDITCVPLSSLSNDALRARVAMLAMTANASSTSYPSVPTLESLGLKGIMKGDWLALVQARRANASASNAVLNEIHKISIRSEFRNRANQLQFNLFSTDVMTPTVATNFIYGELQQ